jgi:hypothetical protein
MRKVAFKDSVAVADYINAGHTVKIPFFILVPAGNLMFDCFHEQAGNLY